MSIHAPSTLAPRILCTGSESSKTTNPKLGSFPPTPLVLIRSSTTFPYAAKGGKKYLMKLIFIHALKRGHGQSVDFRGNLLMKNSLSSLSSMSCGRLPTKSWWLSGYRTIRLLSMSPDSASPLPPAGQKKRHIRKKLITAVHMNHLNERKILPSRKLMPHVRRQWLNNILTQ